MKYKKIIIFFGVFIVSFILFYVLYTINNNVGNKTIISPTCENEGYTIYEKNGKTQYKDFVPAIGHKFSEWLVLQNPTINNCGTRERYCNECKVKESEKTYFDSSMSRICLEGDITNISKTNQVKVEVELLHDKIEYNGYALLKYQGHSSLKYDKKNFTIKFFEDEDCSVKKKITFYDWNSENKFILKANYIDVSRSRNLICADIWSQMVSSRTDVHERLIGTSNYGAVDGFPTTVYLNGEFIGVYLLTLHKDDDLFEMKDDRKDGIVIINKSGSDESLFKDKVNWENTESWEVEYCGTEDDSWLKEKLNTFIDFIINSSDNEFKNLIGNYINVNSLIDYMIAMYTLGLHTNYSKDLIFITYDNDVFIATLFDTENAFGLLEDEETFINPVKFMPELVNDLWSSKTGSLLWDRFLNAFYDEIATRYKELRTNILSEDNIEKVIKSRIYSIDEMFNNADMVLYPNQPLQNISHIDQIMNYTFKSLLMLDEIFIYD